MMKPILEQITPILSFLDRVGVVYKLTAIDSQTFLPGLKLSQGTLIIDLAQLLYPGDIFHEAGHLACMPPEIRQEMSDDLENSDLHQGGEMMAIAWSYAACIHLNLDPEFVFHEEGYKSGGKAIIENFRQGGFMGVPLLQWCGMTFDNIQAEKHQTEPFPYMQSWVCKARP
ncbi:hypothetical protein [Pedobacter rhizosphaerae]|uniref:Uncharacterized protein n=1 Tax=Pedobacter rhizosphaerae TaxID=390241 RepID=A0A1H9TVQ8_9SPHI|nr:hypothetical protein [Pedobacter rhizosphaerae]SES01179.1 hypothetical protein SAMN04488023_1255 [Pedobacter rhizosphaerae]